VIGDLKMSKEIQYPFPPETDDAVMMEVHSRFMRHLRHVPVSRDEIKVLSAIQFTADMMDYNDAQITKILVDMGLRVGRAGLPADYLRYADEALMRSGWDVGGPSASLLALKEYWDAIGEDRFVGFQRDYPVLEEHRVY